MAAKSSWICSISPNLWQKFHGHCCKTHHLTVDGTTLVSWLPKDLPKGFFAWALTKNWLHLIILVDSWLQIFVTCNYYVPCFMGFLEPFNLLGVKPTKQVSETKGLECLKHYLQLHGCTTSWCVRRPRDSIFESTNCEKLKLTTNKSGFNHWKHHDQSMVEQAVFWQKGPSKKLLAPNSPQKIGKSSSSPTGEMFRKHHKTKDKLFLQSTGAGNCQGFVANFGIIEPLGEPKQGSPYHGSLDIQSYLVRIGVCLNPQQSHEKVFWGSKHRSSRGMTGGF